MNFRSLPLPTDRQLFWWTVFLTIAIELLTCGLRFGAGLTSTRDTASTIGVITCGLRIHHSYIGLAIATAGFYFFHRRPVWGRYAMIVGLALLLSDLIHHFLVMYPLTGSPEFHLWYQ
ncbi:hypothetical protein [Planctomycetes bacterium K23_9]|uniref:hypothetical protein n=1 Tax=Stieleria marina TaxID=1930275 RepID=UPI0011AADC23